MTQRNETLYAKLQRDRETLATLYKSLTGQPAPLIEHSQPLAVEVKADAQPIEPGAGFQFVTPVGKMQTMVFIGDDVEGKTE